MQAYQVPKCSRRCSRTGRAIQPGETYYSVVIEHRGQLQRLDFSSEGWTGPPQEAIGWWKAQLPLPNRPRCDLPPEEALLKWLVQLGTQPQQAPLRYVLALLLVRRRVLREVGRRQGAEGPELVLKRPGEEEQAPLYVPIVQPSPQQVAQLEAQLRKVLFPQGESSPATASSSESPAEP